MWIRFDPSNFSEILVAPLTEETESIAPFPHAPRISPVFRPFRSAEPLAWEFPLYCLPRASPEGVFIFRVPLCPRIFRTKGLTCGLFFPLPPRRSYPFTLLPPAFESPSRRQERKTVLPCVSLSGGHVQVRIASPPSNPL